MIKITINKLFKQKNVCQQFDFHDIKLLSEQQNDNPNKNIVRRIDIKKKINSDELLFFFHQILLVSTVSFN